MIPTTTIAEYAGSHPYWPARFLLVYLGNPILFVSYFGAMSDNTSEDGVRILGVRTFRTFDVNISRVNVALYVLVTFPMYALWFWTQARVLIPLLCYLLGSTRVLNVDTFCAKYASAGACAAAVPGLVNLWVWSTEGMEGNAMVVFVLPLLIAAVFYVALWIVAVVSSLERQVVQLDGVGARYQAMDGPGSGASSMDFLVT
jgi:hypothetical protein